MLLIMILKAVKIMELSSIYFTFVLMISLERVVTHYKKLVDFLDDYNMYNELKMELKSEFSKPYNY